MSCSEDFLIPNEEAQTICIQQVATSPHRRSTSFTSSIQAANYNRLPMSEALPRKLNSAIRFGDYELDPKRGVLSQNGVPLKLQPQPFRVFELLIARAPNIVTREELSDYVWGDDVYVDLDQSLNFCIRQIRSVLNDSASNPKFVDTLPKQGYRFIGPIPVLPAEPPPPSTGDQSQQSLANRNRRVGDTNPPPAAPNAVALQDPPPHLAQPHRGNPEPPDQPEAYPPRSSHRRLWLFASALALLILAIVLGARTLRSRPLTNAASKITSLAVLPLDNLSGDPTQNYFADGMTDEITTMLAKNSTLRVVSRTSAMQYKGAHRPLPEIARELGVDGILEGSIARTGDKVHMTIQLIQAPSDTHLWAESYDRNVNDIVALPNEAAQTIAKKLNSAVPQPSPQRYISPEAHDAFLRGRYLWFKGMNEQAGPYFRKATGIQPDYALGWAGLAMYYGQGTLAGEIDPRETVAGLEAARKAVALDDSLPEAHLVLGAMLFISPWDWVQADPELVRAADLNPRYAEAYHFRSKMYVTLNRNEEAIQLEKKAMELDPFERPYGLAYTYSEARLYDAAINDVLQRLESQPGDNGLHWMLCEIYRRKGDLKQAAQEWEKATLLSGDKDTAAIIHRTFQQGGYPALLLWRLNDLKQKATKQYVSPVDLALQYAQLRQKEKALSLLEAGYREHSPLLLSIQQDPAYDFLHSDERYRAIIRGTGLPPKY
ncbi:winged helix-turn-helix domain-containing protein [Tunturiibacter empetritectus]|uniref:TolB-like protein/DNA-binding winged helix-turn-helix (WHTH) protein n=2 Tax=Tunturiibacter TaxID=3154218 RepID=A0A852VCC6_9BACT|nr:winged helix-turn-helix domain-containing protein [Edaphobacter lichenicola]NYF90523.1 TolB-like protein/DNA-binding winged helix-turn-helix (wHTH) protein [Edaphobacter lichenicola]